MDTKTIEEKLYTHVKCQLIFRGFSEKSILNNRGIIGATIEEMVILIGLKEFGIHLK